MRRLLVLALGALLLSPVPSRGAGLGADVLVGGEAHFNIYGSDRASYLIDVVARASEAGTRTGLGSVSVSIRRCLGFGCGRRITYAGSLPAGSFTVSQDLSSGHLSTSLFGRPLLITWDSAQSSTLPSYDVSPDGPRAAVRLYQVTRPAGLVVGTRCRSKEGLVSRSVRVDADEQPAKPLPRATPRVFAGLTKGRCSNPTS